MNSLRLTILSIFESETGATIEVGLKGGEWKYSERLFTLPGDVFHNWRKLKVGKTYTLRWED